MKYSEKPKKYKKSISLYPLKFEDAIKFSLDVKSPPKENKWKKEDDKKSQE